MINLAAVGAMMTVGWIFSVLRRNVTIVDSLWGLGFVLVAGVTFWTGSGFGGRSLLILVLTAGWGLRLAGYLTRRNWGQPEDHRYGQWREKRQTPSVPASSGSGHKRSFCGLSPWYCRKRSCPQSRPESPRWTFLVPWCGRLVLFSSRSGTGSWPGSKPIRKTAARLWTRACGPGAATPITSENF